MSEHWHSFIFPFFSSSSSSYILRKKMQGCEFVLEGEDEMYASVCVRVCV